MSILSVKDVELWIGQSQILNGVNLEVKEGETVGIIGPNGSGKTTLFNCLSGFHFPQKGKIIFKEKEITNTRPYERAMLGLGRVFQNFGVFREMTLVENMMVALEGRQANWRSWFPWSSVVKSHSQRSVELLEEVGLSEKAQVRAGSLSGGQMRLLEIARTLAFEADLFLLDEPTAGVSPKMKGDVLKPIKKLQGLGKTILVIEHDINFIQSFCERIVVLDSGGVVLDGTPAEVRSDPLLQEIYFGAEAEAAT